MRYLIVLFLFSSLFADMNKEEITKEIIYQTFVYIDYRQTKEIFSNPEYSEINPMITEDNVEEYFLVGAMVHGTISYFLPRPYKKWFQNITLGFGATNIAHNYSAGVRVTF